MVAFRELQKLLDEPYCSTGLKGWVHYQLAAMNLSSGETEQTRRSLLAALSLDPSNAKAKSMLTDLNRTLIDGDLKKARDRIESGNPGEAEEVLESIVSIDPTHAEAHYLRALAVQASGSKRTEALVHYRSALDQGFSPFWIRYNRGQFYDTLGAKARARKGCEEALRSPPSEMAADHEMLEWLREKLGRCQ